MLVDEQPYSDHLEPAVLLQATFSTQLLLAGIRNSTFRRQMLAVSLVALQQPRPSSVHGNASAKCAENVPYAA
jgi:hypothetical protein